MGRLLQHQNHCGSLHYQKLEEVKKWH